MKTAAGEQLLLILIPAFKYTELNKLMQVPMILQYLT